MCDHNKCPSSEKEHEKCIFRISYFHRIQPIHRYIKYAQNFFVFSLEAALIKFVRKTVSIIKTQLVWPPTGAGPRQQFALVVKTWIIVSSGTQEHTRPPCTAPHSLCSGLYKILCEMTRIVCTSPWLPLARVISVNRTQPTLCSHNAHLGHGN